MISIERTLNLPYLLEKKSFFLFGPRGVGKSYLIQKSLKDKAVQINLLRPEVFLRLSSHPAQLREMIYASPMNSTKWVVIDEIQKIPLLLDEVHRLIEEERYTVLLTGSSARKLRQGGVNLLAGRARIAALFPLNYRELGDHFNLERYLRFGGLPSVYFSSEPEEDLQAYVATYLQEEIKAEGLIRKLPSFSSFLKIAALSSGHVINFAKLASEVEVSAPTIREYFSILGDTLVGQMVSPWRSSKKRRATAAGKFYFFDTGVTHTLAQTKQLDPNSNLFGQAFEQWVFMELRAWLSYTRNTEALQFWRADQHCEVDFLIGERLAIEVKSTSQLRGDDFSGLNALKEEGVFQHYVMVSHDPIRRMHGEILCLPWRDFPDWLWQQAPK